MDDTWNRNEFKDELEALLNIRLPICQSKIQSLRNLAIKHPKHRNYLVQCICEFIETAPPDYRLPGLYLIDAIVRRCEEDKDEERVASEYRKRFFVILKDGALTGLFHPCLGKDKTRVDKVLSFWSEHVYPKQFVDQLKINVIQDIERRRQPVVIPTNYATDIALQQQGWQPGNTPPPPTTELTTDSASPPVDSKSTTSDNITPRLSQPQLPVNTTLDFSSAVMHFLSGLNYGGSFPLPPPSGSPVYGFPPMQPNYPYLSHTMPAETTRPPTKEVDIKTEDIPTCAEQPTCSSAVVKEEVVDTPFDRPPIKNVSVEPPMTSLPPPRTPPLPPAPLPTQAPPSTPPLPNIPLPAQTNLPKSTTVSVQPPKTPPLPPATPQSLTRSVPEQVKSDSEQVEVKIAPQEEKAVQAAPQKPIPPPKTPPLQSIPPPKTPPLPPRVPQKRLREVSPVSLPKKAATVSSSQPMAIDATPENFILNVHKVRDKSNENATDTSKVQTSATIQEKMPSVNVAAISQAASLTKPSFDAATVISRSTPLTKSPVHPALHSVPPAKPSRWDIKAKNTKPSDDKQIAKSTTDSKPSGSKLSTDAKHGMTTNREENAIGSPATTSAGPTTKRDEGVGLTKVYVGATTKQGEGAISSSSKIEAASNGPNSNISMDTDKNTKIKRTTQDSNTREPSPKRPKTITTERSSGSEPSSTLKKLDALTKSLVEKSTTAIKTEKSSTGNSKPIFSPKTSPQSTKERSSRSTDDRHKDQEKDDRRKPKDYSRERDDRHSSRDYKDDRHSTRDYNREKDDRQPRDSRYYSPQQKHDQPPRHSSPYSPMQPSGSSTDPVYSYSRFARPGPISDPTLRLGSIRVLSRTLYVGPMSVMIKEDEVTKVFSQFGEVMSVIFSYRPDNLKSAFVKFINRESLQAAKDGSDGITFRSRPVKVNWAHGFGPKHCFNYDKGESILLLNRLSDEDCASLKAAPVGGFQGSRLRDQVTVEEPGPLQQSTHRDESRHSPQQYYEVRKFEETERMPQSEYQQQYYGNEYSSYPQRTPVETPNGFYDQQGNYAYFIPDQQPAYYGPPLYPNTGAAGQPQYYHQAVTYQQPITPPTSQQFAQPQYHHYTYNSPNYVPTSQAYYVAQQYQHPNAKYQLDYRRQ